VTKSQHYIVDVVWRSVGKIHTTTTYNNNYNNNNYYYYYYYYSCWYKVPALHC